MPVQAEARLRVLKEEMGGCTVSLQTHALLAADGLSAADLQLRLRALQQEVRLRNPELLPDLGLQLAAWAQAVTLDSAWKGGLETWCSGQSRGGIA